MRGMIANLPSAERRLTKFILEQPHEVINATIEELAEKSQSSYATISRFCKKLGFSGFKGFKSELITSIMNDTVNDFEFNEYIIPQQMSTREIIGNMFGFSSKILHDCYEIIDEKAIETAVSAILDARRLYFAGIGTSGISARYAFTKFFRLGLPCCSEIDSVLCRMQGTVMEAGDVLFAISSSGRSTDIVEVAQKAKTKGATVISLSDYAISPLTNTSDITLFTTPRNANVFKNIELPLLVGQITLIDVLFSCTCVKMPNRALDLYQETKNVADEKKM